MPRQRTHHRSGSYYVFPDDFGDCLVRFKDESGLSWAEIARRLGTTPLTLRRWWKRGVRPQLPLPPGPPGPGRRHGPRPHAAEGQSPARARPNRRTLSGLMREGVTGDSP